MMREDAQNARRKMGDATMAEMNSAWFHLHEQRDVNGALTDTALALDALADNGCDCGEDEPGTCLGCVCEAAIREQFERAERAEKRAAEAERLIAEYAAARTRYGETDTDANYHAMRDAKSAHLAYAERGKEGA